MLGAFASWGASLAVYLEAYFDESGSHADSSILCVAGYVLQVDQARRLEAEWASVLSRFSLPYFHMSECAHGTQHFKALSKEQRIEAEKMMIGIIKRRVEKGFAITVDVPAFGELISSDRQRDIVGDPYTYCVKTCFNSIAHWCNKKYPDARVAYIFEAGHASQPLANTFLNNIVAIPELRDRHKYLSHAFVGKRDAFGLQAADILAWLWTQEVKRLSCKDKKRTQRKDLNSLVQCPHEQIYWDRQQIEELRDFLNYNQTLPPTAQPPNSDPSWIVKQWENHKRAGKHG